MNIIKEALSRRDLMKRTGGSVVGSRLGFLNKMLGQGPDAFNVKNLIMTYIKNTGDIPAHIAPDRDISVVYVKILRQFGVLPKNGSSDDRGIDQIAANLGKLLGDVNLGNEFKQFYINKKRTSQWAEPDGVASEFMRIKYGSGLDQDFGQQMLMTLVNHHHLSLIKIRNLFFGNEGTASKLLQSLVKTAGGSQNLFKPDMRQAKKLYSGYSPWVQSMYGSPEAMMKSFKERDLKEVLNEIPEAWRILGLPEWMAKAAKGTTHIIKPDSDFSKYFDDFVSKSPEEAKKALTTRYTPQHDKLGQWNKKGREINVLKPGRSFGNYTSESISCNTAAYKMLIERIL